MKSEVSTGNNRLEVARVFHAPRSLVFSYWTDPEKYRLWSGCKECVQCDVVMDFRVGGSFTQKMKIAVQGQTCDFTVTGAYDEIVEPERISYSAGFGPVAVRVIVDFIEEGENTRVVVTHDGLPDEFFGQNVAQGTSESFDKLEPLLAGRALAAQ